MPNKATQEGREAIGRFVDGNAGRLQGWLDLIADGIPKLDKNAQIIPGEWEIKPDPQQAFDCVMAVCEYHIPKLARSEIKQENSGHMTFGWADKKPDEK